MVTINEVVCFIKIMHRRQCSISLRNITCASASVPTKGRQDNLTSPSTNRQALKKAESPNCSSSSGFDPNAMTIQMGRPKTASS